MLKKLPGEIRNAIYELVLRPQQHNGHRRARPHVRHRKRYDDRVTRFKESGLLRAAKWIRCETKALCYESKSFEIRLVSNEFEAACDWVRSIVITSDGKGIRTMPFFNVTKTNWDHLHTWLPLAKLFHEVNFNLNFDDFAQPVDRAERLEDYRYDRYLWPFTYSDSVIKASRYVEPVLNRVVALGLKAKKENWHEDTLESEFEQWVEEKVDTELAWKKNMNARLKKGLSEKQREIVEANANAVVRQTNGDYVDKYRYNGKMMRTSWDMHLRSRR